MYVYKNVKYRGGSNRSCDSWNTEFITALGKFQSMSHVGCRRLGKTAVPQEYVCSGVLTPQGIAPKFQSDASER